MIADDHFLDLLTTAANSIRAVIVNDEMDEQFVERGLELLGQVDGFLDDALKMPPIVLTPEEFDTYHAQVRAWLQDVERHYLTGT